MKSRRELLLLVQRIQATLWPEGDPDALWNADTTQEVGTRLADAGFGPGERQSPVPSVASHLPESWLHTLEDTLGSAATARRIAEIGTAALHVSEAAPPPTPAAEGQPTRETVE